MDYSKEIGALLRNPKKPPSSLIEDPMEILEASVCPSLVA